MTPPLDKIVVTHFIRHAYEQIEFPLSNFALLAAVDDVLDNPPPSSNGVRGDIAERLKAAGWLAESDAKGLVIGLDLGGTKLIGAIANARGAILAERTAPTETAEALSALDQMTQMVSDLLANAGAQARQVAQIVVGVPGVVAADGSVSLSPHVRFPTGTSLGEALGKATGLPVFVENDANIAAFGEYVSRRLASGALAFVALGTGIGMGLIVEGGIVRGASGAAGEIGTLPFGADPIAALAEHPGGAFEATVSTGGILSRYRAAGGAASSVREIFERADADEAIAREVVDASLRDLAHGLGTVVALLDPGVIVLGGGIGARPGVAEGVGKWLAQMVPTACAVVPSTLGNRAGLLGALAQAHRLARLAFVKTIAEMAQGAAA